jgi:hypothetical protein
MSALFPVQCAVTVTASRKAAWYLAAIFSRGRMKRPATAINVVDVAECRKVAKQCRDLAARASIPAEKKRLQQMAAAWAKMAAERERYLTDAAETAAPINRRASDQTLVQANPPP